MKIDYKNYMVLPYTSIYLHKVYTKDVLEKFGDRLAFLYQNGYSISGNTSLQCVAEDLAMFNNLDTWEDFDDFLKCQGKCRLTEPTEAGYKMVDSVLDMIIKQSSWAMRDFINIKDMGLRYKNTIENMLGYFQVLIDSSDILINLVVDSLVDEGTTDLFDECYDSLVDEKYGVMLVKYQALYKKIFEMHKSIYRSLLKSTNKGELARVGNINDEIYGSSGGYNPNNDEIIARNGSAVYELKLLNDTSSISTDSIRIKMLVIAKECLENGETDQLLKDFVKGDNSHLNEVRKVLTDIAFTGIMVLLDLKHGLTIVEGDTLNKGRAEKICKELTAICRYCNYKSKELQ